MDTVKFNNLYLQHKCLKKTYTSIKEIIADSSFINGKYVQQFEQSFAKYIQVKHAIGTSNGTDAITILLKSLQCGNPLIIIPGNTFIATALAAKHAYPLSDIVLVDCDEYYQIDTQHLNSLLSKKRHIYNECIIIGVHLFGHPCNIEQIEQLCKEYNCIFIEDASQAHGSLYKQKHVGSFGCGAAFSLYPGKNLGACGDAGIICTNNESTKQNCKKLINFGSINKHEYELFGYNHRLDTIQAAILCEKLQYLDEWNNKRIKAAEYYNKHLSYKLIKPEVASYCTRHVYHIYPIRVKNRNALITYLTHNNIETGIHYPKSINQTGLFFGDTPRADKFASEMVSLPIHPFITKKELEYVCKVINAWVG